MSALPRKCPVCGATIRRGLLMCKPDWFLVPYGLRRAVLFRWQQFRGGVGTFSDYASAAREAVAAARKKKALPPVECGIADAAPSQLALL